MKYLKNIYILYGVIAFLFLSNMGSIFYFLKFGNTCEAEESTLAFQDLNMALEKEEQQEEVKQKLHVDIKGYVKKPGVYEVEEGAIVNDVITLAGGLKSGGTTENINLSKKLIDEAMIVISSKIELQKASGKTTTTATTSTTTGTTTSTSGTSVSSSESTATNSSPTNEPEKGFAIETSTETIENNEKESKPTKVSINLGSKEELMTLSGIGEKTAEKIIEYRATNKFSTIEDIKNVSGIGESIFEKIKDFITI